jgi:hypothetical protein
MKLLLPDKPYNISKLDAELRSALGEVIYGVDGARGRFLANLVDSATPEEQNQVMAIATAHNAAQLTPRQQTFVNVKATAQSAEGILLTDLTAAQVKSLLAVMLYRMGGVSDDGKVRPLSEWAG